MSILRSTATRMKIRFVAYVCLLSLCLSLCWGVTSAQGSTSTAATSSPSTVVTTELTTPMLPSDVTDVTVIGRTENSVTIQFDKVVNITDYRWYFYINGTNLKKDVKGGDGSQVNDTLHDLTAAQTYNMTLHTVLGAKESNGFSFNASTAPANVAIFKKKNQSESSITLEWTNKPNIFQYIMKFKENEYPVRAEDSTGYVVLNLNSTTLYSFTLFSVFENIRSTGANLNASTAPRNADDFKVIDQNETSITLQWESVPGVVHYKLEINENTTNVTGNQTTVSNLQSGTLNNFTLFTVFENVQSSGTNLIAPTAPRNADDFKVIDQNETSITLQWESVPGVVHYILEINENTTNVTGNQIIVSNLQSGTLNNFTLFTVFENVQSSGTNLTAPTAPRNAGDFKTKNQTETSITLEWKKVDNIQDYMLVFDGTNASVSASSESLVTHKVQNLRNGILFEFTLYTRFANLLSLGKKLKAATVPPAVSSVKVTNRELTTITLQWESLEKEWNYLLHINGSNMEVKPNGNTISHPVKFLSPGTVYPFSITTEFQNLTSKTYEAYTVTVIDCDKVDWHVTESLIEGVVEGVFTNATASNDTQQHTSGSNATNTVLFTGLYPGANYTMKLMYEELEQCSHMLTTIPPMLNAKCKDWASGYSVYIEWDKPSGVWDSVEVNISQKMYIVAKNKEQYAEIPNFQPAQTYKASIASRSGLKRSTAFVFMCSTDARGVITGAFFGVVLFILVCVVAYVMLKRPGIISRQKKSLIGRSRTPVKKSRSIPVAKFPSHFNELSADENRGFSEEYEDLSPVGTEQTQKAAVIQENKAKNRFVNVLPYDRSRVKLTSSASHDDYINANYMPGYNSDKEYIAAQGPMPSTVNDFWRMIWEQKVRGIVMVTNCTEGGRTKCEQYWPADSDPRVCGDLAVFTTSEEKESSWTLREFKIKHRCTSEERTVKHFHFTAWPDHGVPLGTEVLIQFRMLVRWHIQTEAAGTPTVVHCSAGVGRTGTIIALDVLLQQLEKEQAVDINGFVQKMRLNRPHMVQTESQYVFLHQCIMDTLQPNEMCEENIYENDVIYANATALREFQNNINKA